MMAQQALTPEQAENRARVLEQQARKLREEQVSYEIGPPTQESSGKSFSKSVINWSFIVFGIMGIIGAWVPSFDMMGYIEFLKAFAFIWAPLVIAVGSGRAVKNYVNKKFDPSNAGQHS
jgi:NADH:ubiquinone oxidoreductase subunit 3 (subunit A)